ncbi:hypothetical protein [Methylomicrobium agile]|uniref:hypothetical protein n=1 Tax=Methylomicrobium agile TaxID=39774 RepID=UPI00068F74A7|nr:hypothetical protein [Methylomicrobium agile]
MGQTRRYGVEAGVNSFIPALFSSIDDWSFAANYTYLNARYLDSFIIQNPLNNDVAAQVGAATKIPAYRSIFSKHRSASSSGGACR